MQDFWSDLRQALKTAQGMSPKAAGFMMAGFLDDYCSLDSHIKTDIRKNPHHRELLDLAFRIREGKRKFVIPKEVFMPTKADTESEQADESEFYAKQALMQMDAIEARKYMGHWLHVIRDELQSMRKEGVDPYIAWLAISMATDPWTGALEELKPTGLRASDKK
jgi:hypothetical protein